MARKRRVLLHPIFIPLDLLNLFQRSRAYQKHKFFVTRGLSPVRWVLLILISAMLCITAAPGLSSTPSHAIAPGTDSGAIAQTSSDLPAAQRLEQLARDHFAARRWNEAATAFQQAAQQYQILGETPRQSICLSNLSLTYQQLGLWAEAEQAIDSSLALVESSANISNSPARQSTLAQALDIRGTLELSQGRTEDAIATWERAAVIHQELGHLEQAQESQLNQSRALQALGLHNRAIAILQAILRPSDQSPPLLQVSVQLWQKDSALDQLRIRLQALPKSAVTVAALRSLAESLQVNEDLEQAFVILQHGLEIAETLSLEDAIAATQLSLGNVTRTQAVASLRLENLDVEQATAQLQKQLSPIQQELQRQRTQAAQAFEEQVKVALSYYEQAANASSSPHIQAQAQLNRLSLLLDQQQWATAEITIPTITSFLNRLPLGRATIDAHISLSQSLIRLAEANTPASSYRQSEYLLQAAQLLTAARQQAIALGNTQAESYALGSLGSLYLHTQQRSEAEALTQEALVKVSAISTTNFPHAVNDVDLAYRWYRQLGQIRDQKGDIEGAIESYETALKILQERLRLDVASSNLNYQLSFGQDAQAPVHRELMDLLLRFERPTQQHLQRVREVSSSLLETQLTSFLQEPCTIATPEQIDTIVQAQGQKAALFYPVVLPDRLEVIVKLPDTADLFHYRRSVPRQQLLETLNGLQIALEEDYTYEAVKRLSQQFYEWFVEPAEAQLQAKQVDTLVFTLDRQLQTIPMAALYDGEDYLIDRYAISEILGLTLGRSIEPIPQENLKIMAAGLSTIPVALPQTIRSNFQPLKNVTQELQEIDALQNEGIKVITLADANFTSANFNTRLNEDRFPVVHLATHGQFSVDPQSTFLMTYSTSDSALINVNEIAGLFRTRGQIRPDSIKLLVLNACETAAGDNLATLGIAGTAVRAGAESAIASLWTLDDAPSVDFTKYLYQNLQQPDITRAEALRQTQLALKQDPRYQHPRYWAPYILSGNWLPLTTSRSDGSTASRA
jgi:CHAT domain-containing protein